MIPIQIERGHVPRHKKEEVKRKKFIYLLSIVLSIFLYVIHGSLGKGTFK